MCDTFIIGFFRVAFPAWGASTRAVPLARLSFAADGEGGGEAEESVERASGAEMCRLMRDNLAVSVIHSSSFGGPSSRGSHKNT